MDFSKKLLAGAVVFIAVFGLSFFLASHFLKFGLAQTSTPKITGTIVLSDEVKFSSYGTFTGSSAPAPTFRFIENKSTIINSNIALPGDTQNDCSVLITGCCSTTTTSNIYCTSGGSSATVDLGGITNSSTSPATCVELCATASGTLLGGNIYEAKINCAQTAPYYLAVSYACDVS